jgi:hypothetical protein
MCCGYGEMSERESLDQFIQAIIDFESYIPSETFENIVINEPNLDEQPDFQENSAFKN